MVPEVEYTRDDLVAEIKAGIAKGKHAIVAITEHMCDVDELASYIEKRLAVKLAPPSSATFSAAVPGSLRPHLASRMGAYAIELLLQGHGGRCVGIQNEKLVHHDIIDAIENMKRPFKNDWLDCAKKLKRRINKRPSHGEGGRFIRYPAVFRQDHPGVIGIQMVAGEESHPAEIDAHVAFADAFASRADRNSRQRLNTNVQFLKVVNGAPRHRPPTLPFILDGQTRRLRH